MLDQSVAKFFVPDWGYSRLWHRVDNIWQPYAVVDLSRQSGTKNWASGSLSLSYQRDTREIMRFTSSLNI